MNKLKADAKAALAKLHAYSAGHKASGAVEETPMYKKLNAAANKAVAKLPWHLR